MIIKNITAIFLSVIGMFALSSCAALKISELQEKLKNEQVCCQSFAEIKYETLKYDDSITFNVQGDKPVFNFEEGKSPFVAVRLPLQDGKRYLRVYVKATYTYGDPGKGNHYYYFIPTLLVLDAQFNVTQKINMYGDEFLNLARRNSGVAMQYLLGKKDEYVIAYVDANLFDKPVTITIHNSQVSSGMMLNTTNYTTATIQPGGNITLANEKREYAEEYETERQQRLQQEKRLLIK